MSRKEIINWLLNNLCVPLTPFFIGAFLRFIHNRSFSVEIFDESELSLSMGLLCLMMIKSVNKLPDKTLADNLANVLAILAIFFVVIFACTSFLKFHMDIKTEDQLEYIVQLAKNKKYTLTADQIYTRKKDDFFFMLSSFRITCFVLTLIAIPTVISFRTKYNLT